LGTIGPVVVENEVIPRGVGVPMGNFPQGEKNQLLQFQHKHSTKLIPAG